MNSFFSREELLSIGFKSVGENVLFSRKASVYGVENITIGNNVRIDDFCFLSGKINIQNYIHISVGSLLFGGSAGITMEDFSGLSPNVIIHAQSDDYSGESLTNPMTPIEYKNLIDLPVHIGRHVIVGSRATILPGVVLGEGCSVGAVSLVVKSTNPWTINAGIPCKEIKNRSKKLLEHEMKFLSKKQIKD